MFALHLALYILLGTAGVFAIVELGLSAYLVSQNTGSYENEYIDPVTGQWIVQTITLSVPPILSFTLFTCLWTLLATAAAFFLPWFYARKAGTTVNGTAPAPAASPARINTWIASALIGIYFVTWVFWLAVFADIANAVDANGLVLSSLGAALIAFAVLLWLIFLALFIVTVVAICGLLSSDWPGYMAVRHTSQQTEVSPESVQAGMPAMHVPWAQGNVETVAHDAQPEAHGVKPE